MSKKMKYQIVKTTALHLSVREEMKRVMMANIVKMGTLKRGTIIVTRTQLISLSSYVLPDLVERVGVGRIRHSIIRVLRFAGCHITTMKPLTFRLICR